MRTYALKGFPVWSADGKKFDASILIALIKSKVIPGQWDDDRNKILPYAERIALVISTTQAAHEAIADILEELRQNLKLPPPIAKPWQVSNREAVAGVQSRSDGR